MRVRFYEVGANARGAILRCDEFPVELGIDSGGNLCSASNCQAPACRIDAHNGQLIMEAPDDSPSAALVNNAAMLQGAIMPGDRLTIAGREFLVSYERTATADPPLTRYRIDRVQG